MNRRGRAAIAKFELPPFIDASCRREPDLESQYPSISAICRGAAFAPGLRNDDRIAYITAKGCWLGHATPHWRLVAFLKVLQVLNSHDDAAAWYRARGVALPSNCLVKGNPPMPLERTALWVEAPVRALARRNPAAALRAWNAAYAKRAANHPAFVACEATCSDLVNPPMVTEADLMRAFGRVPGTLTPSAHTSGEVTRLVQAVWGNPAEA